MPPARPGGDKAPFSTGPLRSGAKAAPGGPRPAPAPRSSDRRHRSLPQRQAGGEGSAGLPPPPGPPARSPQGGKGDGSPGKTPPPGAAPSPSSRGGGVTEPRPEPLSSAPAAAYPGPAQQLPAAVTGTPPRPLMLPSDRSSRLRRAGRLFNRPRPLEGSAQSRRAVSAAAPVAELPRSRTGQPPGEPLHKFERKPALCLPAATRAGSVWGVTWGERGREYLNGVCGGELLPLPGGR